jgi:segregation and condensation protein A
MLWVDLMGASSTAAVGFEESAWTPAEGVRPDEALIIDVGTFEGPLDLLLALARTQKVDLKAVSVTALAEQYIAFIRRAATLRLEIAADYLVMAAWLAFLKSRLLLPEVKTEDATPTGEEMAAKLRFRLMRLAAMREAGARLMARNRLGISVFARGMPEGTRTIRETRYTATLFDLMKAYADRRSRGIVKRAHVVKKREVWSIQEARVHLARLVGETPPGAWVQLDLFLDQFVPTTDAARTARAASFGASLEMARDGLVDLQQAAPYAPIYVRRRADVPGAEGK